MKNVFILFILVLLLSYLSTSNHRNIPPNFFFMWFKEKEMKDKSLSEYDQTYTRILLII